MKNIIIFSLIGLMIIGSTPLIIGHLCEALLNVFDLIRGDCRVRQESKYMEYLWVFFVAVMVLFTICLIVLVFIVVFEAFKTGITI